MTKNISSSAVIYRCRNWTICKSSPWKIDPALLHSGGTPSFLIYSDVANRTFQNRRAFTQGPALGEICIIIPRLIGWVMMGLFPRLDWSLFLGPKSLGAAVFSCARASPMTMYPMYPESIVSRGPPKSGCYNAPLPDSWDFLRYHVQTLHLHRCLLEKNTPVSFGEKRGYVNPPRRRVAMPQTWDHSEFRLGGHWEKPQKTREKWVQAMLFNVSPHRFSTILPTSIFFGLQMVTRFAHHFQ